MPRRDLPTGCDTARFFLNDSDHELQIAQAASAKWETGVRPPLPDDKYPPCALLVSYGSFAEPPTLEGVVVTSAVGLVAKSERKQPNPAAWALLPAGIVAEGYLYIGAVLTMPVWAPIAMMSGSSEATEKRERKEEAKSKLPPPVAACWSAIDGAMEKRGVSDPEQPFVEFEWVPSGENAYVLMPAREVFSDDRPIPIDTRVTLSQGRVRFLIEHGGSLWTDADVECGLRAGDVVATCVKLRK